MAICETCHGNYHACGNCDLEDWEWNYCSKDCLKRKQDEQVPGILQECRISIKQLIGIVNATDGLYLTDCDLERIRDKILESSADNSLF